MTCCEGGENFHFSIYKHRRAPERPEWLLRRRRTMARFAVLSKQGARYSYPGVQEPQVRQSRSEEAQGQGDAEYLRPRERR